MRQLWGIRLMFASSLLLSVGCVLRVSCEVLAYQGYANWAWKFLPFSALLELSALTVFAINLLGTFLLQAPHAQCEPMAAKISGMTV